VFTNQRVETFLMGDLVDLNDYRARKQESSRQQRYDEIMQMIDVFLENNPIDLKPFYVSLTDLEEYMTPKTPITVTWPPMLYTDQQGQKWAASGHHRVMVPDDLTIDRVSDYMVVAERETPAVSRDVRSYEVQGSKGNTYTVTDNGGTWTCTCPGFGWRRKCKHVEAQKNENR